MQADQESDDLVELEENNPIPAIENLQRIYQVPMATDLHPRLAFADKLWPSAALDSVAADVIHQLRQWRGIFIIKGLGFTVTR
jgi:hypothetical protein